MRRFLISTTSAIAYPSLLLFVGAFLTFRPVVVFAESAPAITTQCTQPAVTTCGELNHACRDCVGGGGGACSCQNGTCIGDGGTFTTALVCKPVSVLCEQSKIDECKGKVSDNACSGGGTCASINCATLVGSFYTTGVTNSCVPPVPGGPKIAGDADEEEDGCAVSPSKTIDAGSIASAPIPLGLALVLWHLRLRSRKKKRQQRGY